jgi:hypothetical protein
MKTGGCDRRSLLSQSAMQFLNHGDRMQFVEKVLEEVGEEFYVREVRDLQGFEHGMEQKLENRGLIKAVEKNSRGGHRWKFKQEALKYIRDERNSY